MTKKVVAEFQDYLQVSSYEVPYEEHPRFAVPKVTFDLHSGSRLVIPTTRDKIQELVKQYRGPVKVTVIVEEAD